MTTYILPAGYGEDGGFGDYAAPSILCAVTNSNGATVVVDTDDEDKLDAEVERANDVLAEDFYSFGAHDTYDGNYPFKVIDPLALEGLSFGNATVDDVCHLIVDYYTREVVHRPLFQDCSPMMQFALHQGAENRGSGTYCFDEMFEVGFEDTTPAVDEYLTHPSWIRVGDDMEWKLDEGDRGCVLTARIPRRTAHNAAHTDSDSKYTYFHLPAHIPGLASTHNLSAFAVMVWVVLGNKSTESGTRDNFWHNMGERAEWFDQW